jgi:hypothetical protein
MQRMRWARATVTETFGGTWLASVPAAQPTHRSRACRAA